MNDDFRNFHINTCSVQVSAVSLRNRRLAISDHGDDLELLEEDSVERIQASFCGHRASQRGLRRGNFGEP